MQDAQCPFWNFLKRLQVPDLQFLINYCLHTCFKFINQQVNIRVSPAHTNVVVLMFKALLGLKIWMWTGCFRWWWDIRRRWSSQVAGRWAPLCIKSLWIWIAFLRDPPTLIDELILMPAIIDCLVWSLQLGKSGKVLPSRARILEYCRVMLTVAR